MSSNPLGGELTRLRVALFGMVAAFVLLGLALWRIQVVNAAAYESSLHRQSMRRVRLPGGRGRILDRNGVCLADSRPSYCIAIYMEELRQPGRASNTVNKIEETADRLTAVLGLPREIGRKDIENHMHKRRPLPLLAWRDVGRVVLARWEESNARVPGSAAYISGVDVFVEPIRFYPMGRLAAHALGYVGKVSAYNSDEPYDYYLPEMEGKYGVEKSLDQSLSGVAGGRLIRVDASGFKHDEMLEREPGLGKDVALTIDAGIQRLAEGILRGERGAAVVVDPRNGEVLALASSPTFDPNIFGSSVSATEWRGLQSDEGRPLFSRAVSACYPPGSTFKPIVAFAAMESREVGETTTFDCLGHFDLGNLRFHCWKASGHGPLGVRKALEQSCNSYFCQFGLKSGYQRIRHMAESAGFGRETGINLVGEAAGRIPNEAWPGDICNISIGQGQLLVTPIQMAMFTAAIANGGYLYRPKLVLEGDPGGQMEQGDLVVRMAWSAGTLNTIRNALRDVIQAPEGTGKRARLEGIDMAGKTGSAEYGSKAGRKTYAWMIVFAPFSRPRYAAAIVIENAISGGLTAAPRIRQLMDGIFALDGASPAVRNVLSGSRELGGEG